MCFYENRASRFVKRSSARCCSELIISSCIRAVREARARLTATTAGPVKFVDLSEVSGSGLVYEARLSDAVVFDAGTACGKGRLSDPFRNLLMSEQRPIIVARPSLEAIRTVCLAWDGGKEATRARCRFGLQ